jgi:hypothetical protein
MPLTLRPAGLSSPAYRDWLDYVIVEDGRDVGRLYEDRHSPPEYRWFWSTFTGMRQNWSHSCRMSFWPMVIEAIRSGPNRRIAVTLVEWSGPLSQKIVIDWMVISDDKTARLFGDHIVEASRAFADSTSISAEAGSCNY